MFRDSGRRKIRPLLFWLSGNSAVLRRHCARADGTAVRAVAEEHVKFYFSHYLVDELLPEKGIGIGRRSSHGAATRGAGTLGGDLVTKLRLGALLVEDIEGRQVDVGSCSSPRIERIALLQYWFTGVRN